MSRLRADIERLRSECADEVKAEGLAIQRADDPEIRGEHSGRRGCAQWVISRLDQALAATPASASTVQETNPNA